MSEPLTIDALQRELAASEARITKTIHDDNEPHLTAIQTDRGEITERLDRIEQLLWHGERLAEVERRVIKLAEITGAADLAIPFPKPFASG